MNLKVKIITGFRRDQEYSIDGNEAHKAYFLFLHPEARGIFSDGHAMVGSDIKEIVPDYQGTMGWNPTHILDNDDWNELREKGIEQKIRNLLSAAKEIAALGNPQDVNIPLRQLIAEKYQQLAPPPPRSQNTLPIARVIADRSTTPEFEASHGVGEESMKKSG